MSFEIDIKIEAKELGKDLENLNKETKKNLKTAIKQLSLNVYNEADRLATQRLMTSRENYRNALKYQQLSDDIYIIYLDPKNISANSVESGWTSFDMKPGLLNGPKSRTTKNGNKLNIVPFKQKPFSKEPAKKSVSDMREAIKSIIKDKNITKTVKEFNDKTITVYTGIENPMLKGLTKITNPANGEKAKHTQYIVFRAISSNTEQSKWIHPGYEGAKIFSDLEKYIKENINIILKSII